jgi:hypothetical protein
MGLILLRRLSISSKQDRLSPCRFNKALQYVENLWKHCPTKQKATKKMVEHSIYIQINDLKSSLIENTRSRSPSIAFFFGATDALPVVSCLRAFVFVFVLCHGSDPFGHMGSLSLFLTLALSLSLSLSLFLCLSVCACLYLPGYKHHTVYLYASARVMYLETKFANNVGHVIRRNYIITSFGFVEAQHSPAMSVRSAGQCSYMIELQRCLHTAV